MGHNTKILSLKSINLIKMKISHLVLHTYTCQPPSLILVHHAQAQTSLRQVLTIARVQMNTAKTAKMKFQIRQIFSFLVQSNTLILLPSAPAPGYTMVTEHPVCRVPGLTLVKSSSSVGKSRFLH